MDSFINNTGCTGKSTPTSLYRNKKKYNNFMYVSFYLIPIHIMAKKACVPCVSNPLYQLGGVE